MVSDDKIEIFFSYFYVFPIGVTDYITDTIGTSDSIGILYNIFAYCGENWFSYKDEKCFKVIKLFATRDQAETICNQEYFRTDSVAPTLVLIKSATE